MGIRNRFRLDLALVYKLVQIIPDGGISPTQIREHFCELGGEKVRGVREWANDLGLTHQSGQQVFLSSLGRAISRVIGSPLETTLLEILYYNLATSYTLEVFNCLINNFFFRAAAGFDQTFELDEAKRSVLNHLLGTRANPKYVLGEVNTAIDALTNARGLGKLGIVVSIRKGSYRVVPHYPDWRCAAYILYHSWPDYTSRVRIDEVISSQNSLGRVFFMTKPQVMALLSKLEQERAIALEVVADLSQIGLNPALKAEDFLEMLIHDQR